MFDNAGNLNSELSHADEVSARNDNINTLSNDAATGNLKIHQVVRFNKMGDDDDTWHEEEVLSRAGQATGKYKNCFNICFKSFEEQNLTDIEPDSPTYFHESLRLVLATVAIKSWKMRSVDIKTALLQGERLDRHVYLKPTVEANSKGKLWRPNKCVCGLCDASRHWNLKIHNVMIEQGAQVSVSQATFYWRKENSLHGLLAAHVDDSFGLAQLNLKLGWQ